MSSDVQPQRISTEAAPNAEKLSATEGIKAASQQLRGTILQELASETDHFNEQNKQLLKFHGTYQQEDRDARKARRRRASASITCSWSAARSPAAG